MSTPVTTASTNTFEAFLWKHDEESWSGVITTLLRSIHEVDKSAVQIWFHFYPLSLFKALNTASDPEKLTRQLLLQGDFYLRNQIDSSHRFLYGHRYWPTVKVAVEKRASNFDAKSQQTLADEILELAKQTASELKVQPSLLVGITAVAFMTLQQV